MKIYFCHSKDFDFKHELYTPIRNCELNAKHEIIFPHENEQTVNSKEIIKNCDFVFAEVSFKSTGLGIELGWANAFTVPIVCIHKNGTKISGSLKFITHNFIEYNNSNDLVNKIQSFLSTHNK